MFQVEDSRAILKHPFSWMGSTLQVLSSCLLQYVSTNETSENMGVLNHNYYCKSRDKNSKIMGTKMK